VSPHHQSCMSRTLPQPQIPGKPPHNHTFLGLLAKIKCSICSVKCNNFTGSPLAAHVITLIFRGGVGCPELALAPSAL
jgi:hypothetical protein